MPVAAQIGFTGNQCHASIHASSSVAHKGLKGKIMPVVQKGLTGKPSSPDWPNRLELFTASKEPPTAVKMARAQKG